MRKIGRVLFCILPLLLSLGIQFLVSIPVLFYYAIFKINTAPEQMNFVSILNNLMDSILHADFSVIVVIFWAILSSLVFAYWYNKKRDHSKSIPFKKMLTPLAILGIIFLTFGFQIFINYLYSGIELIHPEWFRTFNALMKSSTGGSTLTVIIFFIYSVIGAPIHEELIFRGVTLHYAEKALPFWAANILQALLFGIMHMNIIQGTYAFLAGLFMGYIYHRTKSIWGSIIFHMIFNFLGSIIQFQDISNTLSKNIAVSTIGILIIFMGMVLYETGMKNRRLQE